MCLGIPGKLVELHDDDGALPRGVVDFNGVRREVCLAYVPGIRLGDYAIVHVGFAISIVDEEEARKTFEVLKEMSQLEELDWMAELVPAEHGGAPAGGAA